MKCLTQTPQQQNGHPWKKNLTMNPRLSGTYMKILSNTMHINVLLNVKTMKNPPYFTYKTQHLTKTGPNTRFREAHYPIEQRQRPTPTTRALSIHTLRKRLS